MPPPRTANEAGSSKEAIIDAAERLFGRHGLDGVSLRQIVAESGSLNNFAVQYHFGGKEGLIRAIFESRLEGMELKRARLLSNAKKEGREGNIYSLIEITFRPIAEYRNGVGDLSYAAFLLALHHAHSSFQSRAEVTELAPITEHAMDLLAAALPHVPQDIFKTRIIGLTTCFLVSILQRDSCASLPEDIAIEDALAVVAAGVAAPAPERVRRAAAQKP